MSVLLTEVSSFASIKDDYYDLEYDRKVIQTDIWKYYGLTPAQQQQMPYPDYLTAIEGIGYEPHSGLVRIAQIRAEKDPERLKHFGEAERRIRNEWKEFRARQVESYTDSEKELYAQMKLQEEQRFQAVAKAFCVIKKK